MSGQSGPFWAALKLLYKFENDQKKIALASGKWADTHTICMGQDLSLKSERKNP